MVQATYDKTIRQKQETKLYDKTIKQRKLENKNLLEVKNMRQKGIWEERQMKNFVNSFIIITESNWDRSSTFILLSLTIYLPSSEITFIALVIELISIMEWAVHEF